MSAVIEVTGLSKYYGASCVLEDVSFRVEPGNFFALVGRNGVGKSTLMRLLMRYEPPTRGSGKIFGRELSDDPREQNSHIGYVSESLDYAISCNLKQFFNFYRTLHQKWDESVFQDVLNEMHINLNRQFKELSRGQKMQVAFAAAIAAQPKLLILDEITAVMDANARSYFMQYLGYFTKQGGTVLMATNIISEVQNFARHILLLSEGRVGLNCPVTEISKNFHKIRRMPNTDDEIYRDPNCYEVTFNSDGSISYIIPIESARRHTNWQSLQDKRGISIEEIFIYFTKSGKKRS